MIKKPLISLILVVLALNIVLASPTNQTHVNLQVKDSLGTPMPGSYTFRWDIADSTSCSNVLYTKTFTNYATDNQGVASFYLDNLNTDFSQNTYFCTYRNGIYIENFSTAQVPNALYANQAETLSDKTNILITHNITANWFSGLFNWAIGSQSINYLYFNGTTLDLTSNVTQWLYNQSSVSSGNSSWNESRANILYSPIIWAYNQTTGSINYINSQGFLTSSLANATYALIGSTGNSSFNQTLTDMLYAPSSWNKSYADTLYAAIVWAYNQTIAVNPFNQQLNTTNNVVFGNITSTGNLTVNGSGAFLNRLGIGTGSPTQPFDLFISSTQYIRMNPAATNATLLIRNDVNNNIGPTIWMLNQGGHGKGNIDFSTTNTPLIQARWGAVDDNNFSANQIFYGASGGSSGVLVPRLFIGGSLNRIGIGTITPSASLDINSTYGNGSFIVHNDTTVSFFINGSNGNVGVGTGTPSMTLEVDGNINMSGSTAKIYAGANQQAIYLLPYALDTTTYGYGFFGSSIRPNSDAAASIGTSLLRFSTLYTSTGIENNGTYKSTSANANWLMGNVSIGTTTSTAKLDVNGSINISGSGSNLTIGSSNEYWDGVNNRLVIRIN